MKNRTPSILTLSGILAAGILGATVFLAVDWIGRFRAEANDRFQLQSSSKLIAFTRLARDSLIRGQTEFMHTAAELLLVNSAYTVQVVVQEAVVLEAHRQDDGALPEPISLDSLSPGMLAEFDRTSAESLDLVLPIESASDPSQVVGYVRVAFDQVSILREVRMRTALVAGITSVIALVVLGVWTWIAWGLRRRGKRAAETRSESLLATGPLLIDSATKRVTCDGQLVELTPKQFDLLCLLAGRPNHVFSDDEIVQAVWPVSVYASSADVKQCVYTLRQRFQSAHPHPSELIANVQGYGYKLAIPDLDRNL